METIIGLGQPGCNIAEKFAQYPQYDIYRIDCEKRPGPKFKKIPKRTTHEEYEQNCPSFRRFLKDASGPYLLVICGASIISGASLRILEQLKDDDIYILYVKPDIDLLPHNKQLQERVTFQVLQQYTRSAVFKKMYIVENSKIEEILQNIPINDYYDRLNDMIVSTIHMINIFNNTDSIIDTFSDSPPEARISTFGLLDPESGEEKYFYDLEMPKEKIFFYFLQEKDLSEEGNLLKRIKDQVKDKIEENLRVSYGIFSNSYQENYGYMVSNTALIQE